MRINDTIVALATAPLAAGVAIVRVSGPQAWVVGQKISPKVADLEANRAVYTPFFAQAEHIDTGVLLPFKAPRSFTGEDVVEFQCHGGQAVLEALMGAILQIPGVRQAEAGEFSRRAVLHGKMDLTAAEGLADLVAAETEEQRRQALHQMRGELGARFDDWRQQIMALRAQVEAGVDFPDEELDVLSDTGIQHGLQKVYANIDQALAAHVGERVRSGLRVAVVGRPNAGKSTLTNLLTGRDTAIVSPLAGTTRDVVEAVMNIGGFPVTLADTAGLRETGDAIEAEGVRRAHLRATEADVLVALISAADWPEIDPGIQPLLVPGKALIVITHIDEHPCTIPPEWHGVPVLGQNLTAPEAAPAITEALSALIAERFGQARQAAQITRARHRQALQDARQHLDAALACMATRSGGAELLSEDLRQAAEAIGRVTGGVGTEDVLDLVFSTFCIGK